MKFGTLHLLYFGADDGAYSKVSETEAKDPQITIDQFEKEVVFSVIPEASIFRGPKKADPVAAVQQFIDFNTGNQLTIPLVFPKPEKNELRIYNSDQTGFHPAANDVWFVFRKHGKLHIGSMSEGRWRRLGISDPGDGEIQEAIDAGSDALVSTTSTHQVYTRDPGKARKALEIAGYRCEYDPSSTLFKSRASGFPYLEAHHLVPLYATDLLGGKSLDLTENITALAPQWHRAIHCAEPVLVKKILDKLCSKRASIMRRCGLELDDLVEIYGCGEIN